MAQTCDLKAKRERFILSGMVSVSIVFLDRLANFLGMRRSVPLDDCAIQF